MTKTLKKQDKTIGLNKKDKGEESAQMHQLCLQKLSNIPVVVPGTAPSFLLLLLRESMGSEIEVKSIVTTPEFTGNGFVLY